MITEASNAPTLSVSIVVHNSCLDQLRITLNSLLVSVAALEEFLPEPVAITLLDNCSAPDYYEKLQALLSDMAIAESPSLCFALHRSDKNSGFGGGHNQLSRLQPGRYFLILNPDVELAADALREALGYLESHDEVVALNPYCERGDGSREYLCKRYPSVLDLLLRGLPLAGLRQLFSRRLAYYEYRDAVAEDPRPVTLLSGACLLCRSEAFTAVGRFDERFFMYFEDFDLSRRLKSRGELVFLPGMRIVHHGGFAARKGSQHIRWFARSAVRFFNLHGWRLL
ncbi:glycosyltransferase family 2 protein [Congregibacter litoralis]|uniref:Putative glycosyltransferase n=1 Tax=Congregibacter litoralis KT71 TaxID=314285 RepID=A4ACN1_9GAMM|nr:glycosyltransferase family 2 protein [Congregibacter litoralis]EAQ96245.1 putative glycosyltransferase [Congregibacter litoralis KT71]